MRSDTRIDTRVDAHVDIHVHRSLISRFPQNPFLDRLVAKAEELDITFEPSPIREQWLYHPDRRAILVWEPDLEHQSLTYLIVVLAHEMGHAVDFDQNPGHRLAVRGLHWLDVPHEVEIAAFVQGFRLLKELWIPISLDHFEMMIEEPVSKIVRKRIEEEHICCLLSKPSREPGEDGSRAAS